MGREQMKMQRRVQRFRVEPSFPLRVFIPQGIGKTYKLRTLGEGGLGFFSSTKDAALAQLSEIDLRFHVGDRTLMLKGSVQYCTFLPHHGSSYLGIKFSNLDSRQGVFLKTIIEAAVKKGHLIQASCVERDP
jgi:hypothetical protein